MNKSQPLVSVIIVNYNGKHYLKNCLSSLSGQSYPAIEVIFVDNGSGDGSAEYVRKEFPSIRIIESKKNLGFAKGNMNSDEKVGMCASKMLFMKDHGMINSTGISIARSGVCWDRGI